MVKMEYDGICYIFFLNLSSVRRGSDKKRIKSAAASRHVQILTRTSGILSSKSTKSLTKFSKENISFLLGNTWALMNLI